jgi:hypothetical protein
MRTMNLSSGKLERRFNARKSEQPFTWETRDTSFINLATVVVVVALTDPYLRICAFSRVLR